MDQGEKMLQKKRKIAFSSDRDERAGFDVLHTTRTDFSYLGERQYIITKKQCAILKAKHIPYDVKKRY